MTILSFDQFKLYPKSFGVEAYEFSNNQHEYNYHFGPYHHIVQSQSK